MQPLRRYGDAFAVAASSVIFALMHGNLIQAPFALIAGVGLGYFVISTGSIWTGVVIHFLNNLFSVVISLVQSNTGQSADFAYTLTLSVSLVAGLGCVVAKTATQPSPTRSARLIAARSDRCGSLRRR